MPAGYPFMLSFRSPLCVAILLCASVASAANLSNGLTDQTGRAFILADHKEPIMVIVFLGVDCPLARLYSHRLQEIHGRFGSRGVLVVGVDSNDGDTQVQVAEFAKRHELTFPMLKDVGHHLADQLGATRTPEAFVLDHERTIRYRGAIDDQYTPGTNRGQPHQKYLESAVDELLSGQPISTPVTKALGCFIDKAQTDKARMRADVVTYSQQVAPILQRHCLECHRPGQVGPFTLASYADVISHADTIREVINNKRMPPWHADPRYGHFANDRSLSADELQTLNSWLDGNRAEGDSRQAPPPPKFTAEWTIHPDIVVSMSKPFSIPATGIVEYQDFVIDPGFQQDIWAQGVEVLPGNRSVVHHVNVYIQPPRAGGVGDEEMHDELLAIFVPGNTATNYPAGLAKRIPAGWKLKLNVHYVTIGSPQTDLSRVGFQLARNVSKQVATHMMLNEDFAIPPFSPDTTIEQEWKVDHDLQLIAMQTHMHLRGRSMRFEASYPNGQTEILLNVPRYDFMWQQRYVLSDFKSIPAGTVLRCVGHFDNSTANPNNPNPAATVHPGKLTTDEMFQGNWEVCLAEETLVAGNNSRWSHQLATLGTLVCGVCFLFLRRSARRSVVEREFRGVE
jgi:peroxiredoxin